jgi:GxxExxY protein
VSAVKSKKKDRLTADRRRHFVGEFKNIKMDLNELTYLINGAIFEVNRILGPGFLEKVYENALLMELKARGIKAAAQYPIKVRYKDQIVGEYFADLLVEDQVIIELKTVDKIERIHEAQLLNYLKATGIKVGLLVNFKSTKADIKRFVLDLAE